MNKRKRFEILALCAAFALGGACGDDLQGGEEDEEFCQEACLVTEVGVECTDGWGITKVQCGPDKHNAAFNCDQGGYTPGEVVPHCDILGGNDEAGTTTTGWGATWDPLAYVALDPTSGVRVIDQDFFNIVLDDFSLLDPDATVLRAKDDGTWFIAYEGELCEALGLQYLDEFATINGHDISSLAAFADAYSAVAGQDELELSVVRGKERVLLSYRVE